MLICPDCHQDLAEHTEQCSACSWRLKYIEGFKNFLSQTDINSPLFKGYFENYEKIAIDDLQNSIQNTTYIFNQTVKLNKYIGNIDGLRVCEIGVGQGNLFKLLAKQKPERLLGIDISPPYFKFISQSCPNAEFVIANAENVPFKDEFDLIIASDILEHVFNVGDFLISVNRALKKDGRFIVRTPYNEDISTYSRLLGCPYEHVHLRNFTKSSLKTVLVGAGFGVEKYHFDGYHPAMKRSFIKKFKLFDQKFQKYIRNNYKTSYDVSSVNNLLGGLLMKPMEITAVTRKATEMLPGK